jgi:hypothetical protein
LTGKEEVPAIVTTMNGRASFKFKNGELTYRLKLREVDGLTQAHIHCGPVGVNGPVVAFLVPHNPTGVDADRLEVSGTLETSDIVAAACTPAITNLNQLVSAMKAGNAYVNAHTLDHPSGEVRGQIKD